MSLPGLPPSANSAAAIAVPVLEPLSARERAQALVETTKPRITRLVTITAGVGFAMAAVRRPELGLSHFALVAAGALGGTALSASGASALNQWIERGRDAAMRRTCARPLPTGRVSPASVLALGLALCAMGVGVLLLMAGPIPALVSLTTIVTYLLVYTPAKTLTPTSTLIGAVPGALPPLIGWTAASAAVPWSGLGQPAAWSLFLIMFVWQVPHTLAIAWMYRDDYAAGGYRVLPVVEPSGARTASMILLWSICLLPVTLAPAVFMSASLGVPYLALATVTGVGFLYLAVRVAITRERSDARRAFIASVIHLPVLLVGMVAEAMVRALF